MSLHAHVREVLDNSEGANVHHTPLSTTHERDLSVPRYVSHDCSTQTAEIDLNPSKKLSAASASTVLRRADPKDLPSYPIHGLANLEESASKAALMAHRNPKKIERWQPDPTSAAGAAASLAHNVKSPEIWKPDPSASASAAAVLSKDYKAAPIWQPEVNSNSGKAAVLAHDASSFVPVAPAQPEDSLSSRNAMRAASLAHKPSIRPKPVAEPIVETPHAMNAASMAHKPSMRSKTPVQEPIVTPSGGLNAAALAHRASIRTKTPVQEVAPRTPAFNIDVLHRVANDNTTRNLHTAHPPKPQALHEKNTSDIVRAASVSMQRKRELDQQQSNVVDASAYPIAAQYATSPYSISTPASPPRDNRSSIMAAGHAHRAPSMRQPEPPVQPRPFYPHLEEAAKKAAAERLARLENEHQSQRNIYLPGPSTQNPAEAEKIRAQKIQAEVARLQQQVADVDKKKQINQHLSIMAAAERNVKERMQNLDTKVAEDQGRIPKHIQEQWDLKAKEYSAEAEKKRAIERESKHGKIDIGGGRWIDEEEVNRIARGNVQPILDEISQKAEAERARQEEIRLAKEEAVRTKKMNAEAAKEVKAEKKRASAVQKDELKRKQQEQREADRLSRSAGGAAAAVGDTSAIERASDEHHESGVKPEDTKERKNWFSAMGRRISRRDKQDVEGGERATTAGSTAVVGDESIISATEPDATSTPVTTTAGEVALGGGIVGEGLAEHHHRERDSVSSPSSRSSSSVRDVAMAGSPHFEAHTLSHRVQHKVDDHHHHDSRVSSSSGSSSDSDVSSLRHRERGTDGLSTGVVGGVHEPIVDTPTALEMERPLESEREREVVAPVSGVTAREEEHVVPVVPVAAIGHEPQPLGSTAAPVLHEQEPVISGTAVAQHEQEPVVPTSDLTAREHDPVAPIDDLTTHEHERAIPTTGLTGHEHEHESIVPITNTTALEHEPIVPTTNLTSREHEPVVSPVVHEAVPTAATTTSTTTTTQPKPELTRLRSDDTDMSSITPYTSATYNPANEPVQPVFIGKDDTESNLAREDADDNDGTSVSSMRSENDFDDVDSGPKEQRATATTLTSIFKKPFAAFGSQRGKKEVVPTTTITSASSTSGGSGVHATPINTNNVASDVRSQLRAGGGLTVNNPAIATNRSSTYSQNTDEGLGVRDGATTVGHTGEDESAIGTKLRHPISGFGAQELLGGEKKSVGAGDVTSGNMITTGAVTGTGTGTNTSTVTGTNATTTEEDSGMAVWTGDRLPDDGVESPTTARAEEGVGAVGTDTDTSGVVTTGTSTSTAPGTDGLLGVGKMGLGTGGVHEGGMHGPGEEIRPVSVSGESRFREEL